MSKAIIILASIGILLSSSDGLAQSAERGAESYKVCADCHGVQGQGNQAKGAPKLAGQASWYLARQIKNFRDRIRGGSEADARGHTMSQIAENLMSDQQIQDLVAYIGTLPAQQPAHTIDGDVTHGKALFATCAGCHGAQAGGDATTGAPVLAGMSDWYLLAQLGKFKSGVRGADMDDIHGGEMAPNAEALADEQSMRDVVAYINTL